MSGKRTANHLHLNKKGEKLWDQDESFRRRVKVGAQFVADDSGIPTVIRNSEESAQDRVLIILYPRPPRWIHR